MGLKSSLEDSEEYFFGALAGIFLYISLSSLFPVLHDIIDDPEVIGNFDDPGRQAKAFRNQQFRRLLLANFGFFTAMGLMVPLVNTSTLNLSLDQKLFRSGLNTICKKQLQS